GNRRRRTFEPRASFEREDKVMGFSAKQVKALRRNLDHRYVRTREANGRELSSHHLRFAQPRAIGLKVSDEFTVPLCRGHHRPLHQAGNEEAWWAALNIAGVVTARDLWAQTRPNTAPSDNSINETNSTVPQ